jgi:hypothetical protein
VDGALAYDVVRGSVTTLFASRGDFIAATGSCLADNLTQTSVEDADLPLAGEGFWYSVRAEGTACSGTFDSGTSSQVDARDYEINASGSACP